MDLEKVSLPRFGNGANKTPYEPCVPVTVAKNNAENDRKETEINLGSTTIPSIPRLSSGKMAEPSMVCHSMPVCISESANEEELEIPESGDIKGIKLPKMSAGHGVPTVEKECDEELVKGLDDLHRIKDCLLKDEESALLPNVDILHTHKKDEPAPAHCGCSQIRLSPIIPPSIAGLVEEARSLSKETKRLLATFVDSIIKAVEATDNANDAAKAANDILESLSVASVNAANIIQRATEAVRKSEAATTRAERAAAMAEYAASATPAEAVTKAKEYADAAKESEDKAKESADNAKASEEMLSKAEDALEAMILNRYTLSQYMQLKNEGKIENRFYSVYKNGELYRMYLGETVIMKKAENGEQVTVGATYPLVFPIIFA